MSPMVPSAARMSALQANASVGEAPSAGAPAKKPNPEVVRAARQFESVFVRMMLEPLQKTAESKKSAPGASAGGAYGSMVVDALSDAISQSGGVGLVHMIEEALSGTHARPK
ncbi:MAG: hypothetical protein SFV15_23045 [Polyangiaceae bacterium]|nr:hypothetical protein [Polyangiaceae bacterium]